jgi:GTPase SAR1 family protein
LELLDNAWNEDYAALRQRYFASLAGLIICVPIDEEADFNTLESNFVEALLRVKDIDRYDPMARHDLPSVLNLRG